MTKFQKYQEKILGTEGGIDPDADTTEIEMVINTSDGMIQSPEKYFSVGWLKQPNGTFLYKGFKIKLPKAKILELSNSTNGLDYELREDLTLKA